MITEKYWDNYFDLFASPGWRQFVEESTENYNSIYLERCKDWNDFLTNKTEKLMLEKIIKFEELIRSSYDRWNNDPVRV
jgi:hypothetical protein